MIAERIGGFDRVYSNDMYARREKARANKPECVSCGQPLAYDRANEKHPVCESCHRKLKAQGQRTPDTIHRAERRKQGAAQRQDYAPAMPRLKQARLQANLTQKQLAARANVETNLVSDVERGKRRPKKATAQRVADALSVSLEDLS